MSRLFVILFPWRDAARYRWLRMHYEFVDATNAPFVTDRPAVRLDAFCDRREGGYCDGRGPTVTPILDATVRAFR